MNICADGGLLHSFEEQVVELLIALDLAQQDAVIHFRLPRRQHRGCLLRHGLFDGVFASQRNLILGVQRRIDLFNLALDPRLQFLEIREGLPHGRMFVSVLLFCVGNLLRRLNFFISQVLDQHRCENFRGGLVVLGMV